MTDTSQSITFFDDTTTGSTKAAMSNAKSADLWMVPFSELHIADGFNVRVHDAEYEKHIEWLAQQMAAKGYDRTKPMSGYVVKDGRTGASQVYITDGHSRYAAVVRARERGANIENVPVVVHPPGTSAEDLTVALVTANSGRPLSPFEIASVCQRLQGYGHDEKTIAQKLGYSVPYVKNLFALLAAPKAVREMVTSGKVSATLAVQTIKKEGKNAAKALKDGMAAAEAKGKKKVTGKHVKKADPAPAKKAGAKAKTVAVEAQQDAPSDQAVDLTRYTTLIKRMADYIRTVRVGDDAADMLAEADALQPAADESDDL